MSTEQQNNGLRLNKPEANEVSLKERLVSYIRYIPFFAISIGLALVISFIYLRYATPVYNVRASLLIKDDNSYGGGPNERFAEMMFFGDNNNLSNEIEILQSKTLMQRVVRSLNLQTVYYAIGKIKTTNVYKDNPMRLEIIKLKDTNAAFSFHLELVNDSQFRLNQKKRAINFNEVFQNETGTFRIIKNDSIFPNRATQEFSIVWMPVEQAAAMAQGALKVRPVNVSASVLVLSMITENTKLGEDIINQLMVEYNKATLEDKNQIAQSTYKFIDNRIRLLAMELGDVEKNLQDYKKQNQIFNLEGQTGLYVEKMTEYEKLQNDNEVKLQVVKIIEDYIEDQENIYSLVPSSLGIQDPTLTGLITSFNLLVAEREKKLKETTPENFLVKELEGKIEKSRNSIKENLKNIKRSYELIIKDYASQNLALKGQVRAVPEKEKQLREIARQQGIKENLYLYLLQKREETAITLASTISNSRVVDQAVGSKTPISPNKKNIYLIAFALGSLIPVLFIYIKDLLNDKVQNTEEVQKATKAPVIGTIGHSRNADLLIVRKGSRKMIAEQFRIMRTNLQYFVRKEEKPVILVTSSFSGEGKSFVSINLGSVMALAGKRTVILELDIRKPKIASGLRLNKKTGITNYLVGNVHLDDIILPVDGIENLFVIPCGPIPPNPAELLLEAKLNVLFEKLKEKFDVMIVDSAPVGLVSDAIELGKYSSCTVYIVRQRYTLKKQLKLVEETYSQKRLPRMSVLLNDVKMSAEGYYGYKSYGAGYGYGHGYGYGYFEEEKETKNKWSQKMKKMFLGK